MMQEGPEEKFFDQYRLFQLKENTQTHQPDAVNWWPEGLASWAGGPWANSRSLWDRQMDCAELQHGYANGQYVGKTVSYNKLEWTASFSSYFAYGQGVYPDNASFFWCAPPASFGGPNYELNRCYRNYLTGSSRVTYRILFYVLKDEGKVRLNAIDEEGLDRGDLSIADIYSFHKPSTNHPALEENECPIIQAHLTQTFLTEAVLLHDETIEVSGTRPQVTSSGSIPLNGISGYFWEDSSPLMPPWSRAKSNRIMCSVVATAYNQNGIQSFHTQWPRAWVNTRLFYTNE